MNNIRSLTQYVKTSAELVGKPSSAYRKLDGFFPVSSGFHPPLLNKQLDISEIILKKLYNIKNEVTQISN